MIFVAVAVLIGIAGTVSGDGCCTPDQWQGFQGSGAGYNGKRPGFIASSAFISYDATNKQLAVKATYYKDKMAREYNIVVRYSDDSDILKWCIGENCGSKGKMYIVDLQNNKCFVKKLRNPFRKMCIPEDSKSSGNFYFGTGSNTLDVKSFYGMRKSRRVYVESSVTVTVDGCIPVGESLHGAVKGIGFMEVVGFGNITAGIKDPSIFDVPKQCAKNPMMDTDELPEGILDNQLGIIAF